MCVCYQNKHDDAFKWFPLEKAIAYRFYILRLVYGPPPAVAWECGYFDQNNKTLMKSYGLSVIDHNWLWLNSIAKYMAHTVLAISPIIFVLLLICSILFSFLSFSRSILLFFLSKNILSFVFGFADSRCPLLFVSFLVFHTSFPFFFSWYFPQLIVYVMACKLIPMNLSATRIIAPRQLHEQARGEEKRFTAIIIWNVIVMRIK